ncbi:MAG: tetratricopeptide repeat protein [Runella zeae]
MGKRYTYFNKISKYWIVMFLGVLHSSIVYAQVERIFTLSEEKRIPELILYTDKIGLQSDTVKLFKMYDTLLAEAKARNEMLIYWYAQIYKANHQQLLRFNNDAAGRTAFFKNKQAFFEQSPYPIIRAVFSIYLSYVYFKALNFNEAFKLLLSANQTFEQIGYENIPEISLYLSVYFEFYYYFEDYPSAIKYSILAQKHNKQNLMMNEFLLNNRGMAYLKMKDYKNAEKAFLETLKIAKKVNSRDYTGIASGNYGNTLRLQKHYKASLPYLYADLAANEKALPENSAITCLYLAYSLLKLDSTAKAKTFIDKSLKLHPRGIWTNFGVTYYDVQTLYYQKKGDYTTALLYRDSLSVLKDSLRKVFDNKILLKAHAQIAAEKYINDLEEIASEKDKAVWKRNFIIAFILIASAVFIFYLNRRRLRDKVVQECEKKQTEALLLQATTQLAHYMESIKNKNELIEKISAELDSQKGLQYDPTLLETLHHRTILTDDDWRYFKHLFEQVYPNFFDNLHLKYPDLTPAEIRLIALLKLDLTSKEMAYMLGVSTESLRKSRYRLRKKLEFHQEDTDFKLLLEHL